MRILEASGGNSACPGGHAARVDSPPFFGGEFWSGFSAVPAPQAHLMNYRAISAGNEIAFDQRRIRNGSANQVMPAVGHAARRTVYGLAFSGAAATEEYEKVRNAIDGRMHVIIETSMLDADKESNQISKHLCRVMPVGEMGKLKSGPRVHIIYLMPGRADDIMRRIAHDIPPRTPRRRGRGRVFERSYRELITMNHLR